MPIKTIFKNQNFEWIDAESVTQEDLDYLHKYYQINQLILEDTLDPNHLPKYEKVDGVKFFLMRESTNLERHTINNISDLSTKLGLFILPNIIVTTHRMKSKSVQEVLNKLENNLDLSYKITTDQLALELALKVVKTFDDESYNLLEAMDDMEDEIFLRNTKQNNQIRRLYKLKRKAGFNIHILSISTDWIYEFKDLNLEDVRVMDLIDKQKDALADFEHITTQTNNLISMYLALSDQKANQVMKLLAIYSVYFLPITFIAGVYGMNFDFMPELHIKYGYFYTLGLMALIVFFTFIYMKRKRW